jgi:hypothetical protein
LSPFFEKKYRVKFKLSLPEDPLFGPTDKNDFLTKDLALTFNTRKNPQESFFSSSFTVTTDLKLHAILARYLAKIKRNFNHFEF